MNVGRWVFVLCLVAAVLVPGRSYARQGCQSLRHSEMQASVSFVIDQPMLDKNYDTRELSENNRQIVRSWMSLNDQLEEIWRANDLEVGGLIIGAWRPEMDVELETLHWGVNGRWYCSYFKRVDVKVHYRTLMYMAKEFPEESCRHKLILDHMILHLQSGDKAVLAYEDRLKQRINGMLQEIEESKLPYATSKKSERYQEMVSDARAKIAVFMNEFLNSEITMKNSEIDTRENHEALMDAAKACDGEGGEESGGGPEQPGAESKAE